MSRPMPVSDPDTAPFWDATARHELVLPWCTACARLLFPPPPRCPSCLREPSGWRTLSGRGTVAGWTLVHADLVPGVEVPNLVGEVELDEQPGLLVTTTLVGIDADRLQLGMAVEVAWLELDEHAANLPFFRPAVVR